MRFQLKEKKKKFCLQDEKMGPMYRLQEGDVIMTPSVIIRRSKYVLFKKGKVQTGQRCPTEVQLLKHYDARTLSFNLWEDADLK